MVYNIFSTSQIPLYCGEYSTVPRPKDRTPLISEWIQSCILTHSGCNQADSQLPTRIIDLACPEGIKLCSGTELVGRYAALSHCWGKPPFPVPLSTTKATLLDREAQISEGELTKTFQDAITLARKLSVQYMWADSLCIVQDDEDEWNRESANMASVYENAYVVIAATEAAHGDHNYFDPNNMFASRRDQQLPLLFRSWCLQERLLATRIVHLTQSEVFWECKSETLCECSKRVFSTRHVPKDLEEERLFIKRAWKTCSFPFELWHRTLTMYMKLDITKQSDRLPAVSGFAKRLQITGTGEYIAGLWRNNIFADMLWYGRNGERVEIWQAPSWSCACLKSNV
ncbi:HET-domain-containing protein, partial [Acephala macrosclerotiorum]